MRIVDPTGLYTWDKSAGGDASDKELKNKSNDKSISRQERNSAKKALAFRQQFRNSLAAANMAIRNGVLSDRQTTEAMRALGNYGDEGELNGVSVGAHIGGDPGVTTPEANGISVSFRDDVKGNNLATVIAHEGQHVGDNKLAECCSMNISHGQTEHDAYAIGAYVAQALGMNVYPADSKGYPQYQMWNKGWQSADQQTLRERGIGNFIHDRYTDADRLLPKNWTDLSSGH
jgi:hypothetical protein